MRLLRIDAGPDMAAWGRDGMEQPTKRKIFCIGFNKTGTSSLFKFFTRNEFAGVHHSAWPNYSRIRSARAFFDRADCFTDGEKADFVRLDKWFPDAFFILNTRDETAWLRSRVKHVLRFNRKPGTAGLMDNRTYGAMAKDFFFDESLCLNKWIAERRLYHKQAREYFTGNGRFLEIDITATPSWQRDIETFGRENGLRLDCFPDQDIHENKRADTAIIDKALLEHYFKLIDAVRSGFGTEE